MKYVDKKYAKRANAEIRQLMASHRIRQWEVAGILGIHESALCRWLRTPLSDDKKALVMSALKELVDGSEKEES